MTVLVTNAGKFVGAEGQWGPRSWYGPVETPIPTYISTDAFHAGAFYGSPPTDTAHSNNTVQTYRHSKIKNQSTSQTKHRYTHTPAARACCLPSWCAYLMLLQVPPAITRLPCLLPLTCQLLSPKLLKANLSSSLLPLLKKTLLQKMTSRPKLWGDKTRTESLTDSKTPELAII
jgi:hypothetical protein